MKPPWKYLARLVSRQRSSEIPDEAVALERAGKPVEIELRPTETVLSSSPEADPRGEEKDDSSAVDRVTAPAAIDSEADSKKPPLAPSLTDEAKVEATGEQFVSNTLHRRPTGEAAAQMPKLRRATLKNAKKGAGGAIIVIPVTKTDAPVPVTPRPEDSFFDDAKTLDDDIKQLKHLLAQRLSVQNAQLREMLERFDRS
jgi:hypothetical protein